jgi:hypothetical protein
MFPGVPPPIRRSIGVHAWEFEVIGGLRGFNVPFNSPALPEFTKASSSATLTNFFYSLR